jgi:hypothetical protein
MTRPFACGACHNETFRGGSQNRGEDASMFFLASRERQRPESSGR